MKNAPLLSLTHRVRPTPYSARVEAAGAKAYTVYNHMVLPAVFESAEADYRHLLEHVQVWDVSVQRQVEIVGPDAFALTQFMTPRDLTRCDVGQCMYAPLVDDSGGIVNDPVVLKLADDRFWLSLADSDAGLWAHGIAVGRGLDVRVFEPDVSPLAVQGPKAFDLVSRVFGEQMRKLRFFRFVTQQWHGVDLVIARSGWSHQGGVEIYLPDGSLGNTLWDTLFEAGVDLNVRAGGPNSIERIEAGLLSYGSDMTREHNPFEAGLESYCQLPADCEVLCRDALARLKDAPLTRKVQPLVIAGEPVAPCRRWWPVQRDGRQVGHVSSAAWSPRLNLNIALGMMPPAFASSSNDNYQLILPDGTARGLEPGSLPFG